MVAKPKLIIVSGGNGFTKPDDPDQMAKDKLAGSGLTPADAKQLGMVTMTGDQTRALGVWSSWGLPAIGFNYYDPWTGQPMMDRGRSFMRFRALRTPVPKPDDFKKYLQLRGSPVYAYFPRLKARKWPDILGDAKHRLIITEGELKAACACKHGFPTIGLGGVWMFRVEDREGVKRLLKELAAILWPGRQVIIIFDNDPKAEVNRDVELAREFLANELINLDASVYTVNLPEVVPGKKCGIDDYLVAMGREKFQTLLDAAEPMQRSATAQCIVDFNDRYLIAPDGGKTWVMQEKQHPVTKRRYLDRMKKADFETLYMNEKLPVGSVSPKGVQRFVTKAEFWLSARDRRQYRHGVIFDPSTTESRDGTLNLWQGYAYEPKRGDWGLMKDHMRRVICSGNREYFDYLYGWLATAFQYPARPAGVGVVMRGMEGVGKGILAQATIKIYGQHGLAISNAKHLVGNFNSHLRDCVFLFADEAFFAGDKAHTGVLKQLITEPELFIEAKNQNGEPSPNYLHVMMASNSEWVVPASVGARRFFVLEVSDARRGDFPYFKAIIDQLEAGGYEAMLYDLLNHDLSGFEIRDVPNTIGLQRQKMLSFPTELRWLQDVLYRGYVAHAIVPWEERPRTQALFLSYSEFAKEAREFQLMDQESFGAFLRRMGIKKVRPIPKGGRKEDQYHGYLFGPLREARERFCATTGTNIDWPY